MTLFESLQHKYYVEKWTNAQFYEEYSWINPAHLERLLNEIQSNDRYSKAC